MIANHNLLWKSERNQRILLCSQELCVWRRINHLFNKKREEFIDQLQKVKTDIGIAYNSCLSSSPLSLSKNNETRFNSEATMYYVKEQTTCHILQKTILCAKIFHIVHACMCLTCRNTNHTQLAECQLCSIQTRPLHTSRVLPFLKEADVVTLSHAHVTTKISTHLSAVFDHLWIILW